MLALARRPRPLSTNICHSCFTAPSLPHGRLLVVYSTIALKTRSTFPVSKLRSLIVSIYLPVLLTFTDEIKWQIRMPERIAMREESFVYNDKIQDEILKFMGNKI